MLKRSSTQLVLLWLILIPWSAHPAELAIVIDDIGYNKTLGARAINLPGQVTIAVLPIAPHTQVLLKHAVTSGKDVIVHQPMESQRSPHAVREPDSLTLSTDSQRFEEMLTAALDAVPMSIGLSNHTGSLLTQHHRPMQQLMVTLNRRGLYFLDSRTTPETVAMAVALENNVPAIQRDVFLDHNPDPDAIHDSFELALRVARAKGHAVLIAHPYGVSLDYLERRLANLPSDIGLINASALAQRAVKRQVRPTALAQLSHLTFLHK